MRKKEMELGVIHPLDHGSISFNKFYRKKHSARDSIDRVRPKCTLKSATARFQLYMQGTTLSKSKQD